ncbi:MAG: type II toxin-antitoxin system VapC family toxin [Thermomicrobiales bacterium]
MFDRLPIEIDNQSVRGPAGQRLFNLGFAYRLSVYDATYLELAIRQGLPLATQDRRLTEGAEATGVTILDL